MAKILIIGNGFDIAHKLPTTYEDFLDFCIMFQRMLDYPASKDKFEKVKLSLENEKNEENTDGLINNHVLSAIREIFREQAPLIPIPVFDAVTDAFKKVNVTTNGTDKKISIFDSFKGLIHGNTWIKHFEKARVFLGQNWIDFETEIGNVLKNLNTITSGRREQRYVQIYDSYHQMLPEYSPSNPRTISTEDNEKAFIEKLATELDNLIRALEIYFTAFVEQVAQSDAESIDRIPALFLGIPYLGPCVVFFYVRRITRNYSGLDADASKHRNEQSGNIITDTELTVIGI